MEPRALRPRSKNINYIIPPAFNASPSPKPTFKQLKVKKHKKNVIMNYHSSPKRKEPAVSLESRLPAVPEYTPMESQYPLHSAYNRLPLGLHNISVSACSIFRLFFIDDLFQIMTINTNSYAAKKHGDSILPGRDWKEVNAKDLRVWVGICIYMGLFTCPSLEDYWKHDGLHPVHPITKFMTLNQFQQIKRYLHISAVDIPTTLNGRRLWHRKVDPLLDRLHHSSQRYWVPSSNVSIDEAMIRCTGRSQDTYKMPSKPIERGFKFHCLADHGYIWDFLPTFNQAGPDPVPGVKGLTPTGEVVYYLASKLPKRQTWLVYLDNYYTSQPV